MITTRPATPADLDAMLALIRGKADFDGCLQHFRSSAEELHDAFFGSSPKAHALLAERDGRVLGIATFYPIYSTFIAKSGLWLDDLFVWPHERGRGAGKALLRGLAALARRRGDGRIDWIVARDNAQGRGFYAGMGAHIFEEVRHARLDEVAIARLAE